MIEQRDDGETQAECRQRMRDHVKRVACEAVADFTALPRRTAEDYVGAYYDVAQEVVAAWSEYRAELVAPKVRDEKLPALWDNLEKSVGMLKAITEADPDGPHANSRQRRDHQDARDIRRAVDATGTDEPTDTEGAGDTSRPRVDLA